MWRQNPIPENPDSDQSISEEEEFDDVFLEDVVSVNPSVRNKEELPLPERLDFLRGASNQSLDENRSSSPFEKPAGAPLEDEVELPDFEEVDFNCLSGEVVANSSDEEITSEDEGNIHISKSVIGLSTKDKKLHKFGPEQVADIHGESVTVSRVKESVSCLASHSACSTANRSGDGIGRKVKPRFSLQLLSNKHKPSGPFISNSDNSVSLKIHKLPQTMEAVHHGFPANSVGSYLEDDGMGEHLKSEPAEACDLGHGFNPHSMADLVDNLQDKYLPLHYQTRGKKVKHFQIRSRSRLQDRIVDGEYSPEPMDSGSSSDNEAGDQNMKIALTEKKMLTMADRFQEALGASYVTDEGTHIGARKSFGAGIFENLQRVMQKEKESDMDFLRKSFTGASPHSGHGWLDVKVISRHFDAKLTVCCCSVCTYTKDNTKAMVSGGRETTIIFSPRVCDNVDLEVGNIIRIYRPWKEVQVGNDNMVLCTYFSEIPHPV